MNIALAHISGENLALLSSALEKNLTKPYAFSSGAIRGFAFEQPFIIGRTAFTVVLLDFCASGKCDVTIMSDGAGADGLNLALGAESRSTGLVLDLLKDICAASGWRYAEQRRVLVNPPSTEA